MNRNISILISLAILLLLSYAPLIVAIEDGAILNERSYWNPDFYFYGDYVSSNGNASFSDRTLVLGGLETKENSWATWKSDIWALPFMSKQMLEATKAYVLISGSAPMVNAQSAFNSTWNDGSFISGWMLDQIGTFDYNSTTDGDVLTITGNFEAGKAGSVWASKEVNPAISTDDFPYILFRVRLIEGSNSNWMVQVVYTDNTIEWWCGNNAQWASIVKEMVPAKKVQSINMRVENNREAGWTGSGQRSVAFDYVMISSVFTGQVGIQLNGDVIFSDKLTFERNGFFTLPPNQNSQDNYLRIPIDLPKVENLVKISVSEHVLWNITSVALLLATTVGDINPQAWQLLPYKAPVIFATNSLIIVGTVIMLRKLRKWIKSL